MSQSRIVPDETIGMGDHAGHRDEVEILRHQSLLTPYEAIKK